MLSGRIEKTLRERKYAELRKEREGIAEREPEGLPDIPCQRG